MSEPDPDATRLLTRIASGDAAASDQLLALVYDKLRLIARGLLWDQGGHTLQPTAMVHEAYMKMAGHNIEGREAFVAVAVKAMRQVLIDHARGRNAEKRGGGAQHVALVDSAIIGGHRPLEALELTELLEQLEAHDPRAAQVVELRLLGGLTHEEISRLLDVSEKTVRNDWRHAKAWLRAEFEDRDG